jgi:predicted HTH transcriptional regulator
MNKTEKSELKEIVTDDIYKSVIAFANNGGGAVQIEIKVKNADGDRFEDMRSLEQDLTFYESSKVFKANNIPFGDDKFAVLDIKNQL